MRGERVNLCFFHYETQKTSATVFFPSGFVGFFFLCLSFQKTGIEDPDPHPSGCVSNRFQTLSDEQ